MIDEASIKYEDGSSGVGSQTLGIKELAMQQFNRVQIAGSKEMHPGGVRQVLVEDKIMYVPKEDTISEFINAVETFDDTLYPFFLKKEKELATEIQIVNAAHEELQDLEKKKKNQLNNSRMNGIPYYAEENEKKLSSARIKYARAKQRMLSRLCHLLNFFEEGGVYG